jgi:hypothetical protein
VVTPVFTRGPWSYALRAFASRSSLLMRYILFYLFSRRRPSGDGLERTRSDVDGAPSQKALVVARIAFHARADLRCTSEWFLLPLQYP